MAVLTKVIKADGTGDYTSPVNWEAAITSNATDQWIGDIQDTTSYTGNLTFNVSDTNVMDHILQANAAYSHGGAFATGGRMTTSSGHAITAQTRMTIRNMAITTTAGSGGIIATKHVTITGCMFRIHAGGYGVYLNGPPAGGTTTLSNNCVAAASNYGYYADGGNAYTFNTYGNSMRSGGGYTMTVAASGVNVTWNCYDNIALNAIAQAIFAQAGTINADYNAVTSGASSANKGAHGWTVTTAILTSVTAGSENFTLTDAFDTRVADNTLVGTNGCNGVARVTGHVQCGAMQILPAAPTVDATPAPNASYTVGDAYSVDHAFTGTGTGTWDVSAGAVPSGTSIAGATGIVSGTLTTAQAVSYTARVTDGWGQTGTRQFTTTINAVVVPSVGGPLGLDLALEM